MNLETDWPTFVESRLKQWLKADSAERRNLRDDLLLLADWFSVPQLEVALDSSGLTEETLPSWKEAFFPKEAVFVDPDGFVVKHTGPYRSARLVDEDGTTVLQLPFFLPGVSEADFWCWEELKNDPSQVLSQWKIWLDEGVIQAAGPVEQPFRYEAGSAYYAVAAPGVLPWSGERQRISVRFPERPSFLKRAEKFLDAQKKSGQGASSALEREQKISPQQSPSFGEPSEELPMIPFTLADLSNPNFTWPYEGELSIPLQKSVRVS